MQPAVVKCIKGVGHHICCPYCTGYGIKGNVLKLLFFIKVPVLSFKINTFNITMYEIRVVYGSPEAVLGPQTGLKCSC